MSSSASMRLAVLWEHEIRRAAKAAIRAHALGSATDGERDTCVFIAALIDAMNASAAALAGAEDDDSHLVLSSVPPVLAARGIFRGHEGLEGLLNADAFWDSQLYGTRLYYGDGIADYLHRDVLRAAVEALREMADAQSLAAIENPTAAELEPGYFGGSP